LPWDLGWILLSSRLYPHLLLGNDIADRFPHGIAINVTTEYQAAAHTSQCRQAHHQGIAPRLASHWMAHTDACACQQMLHVSARRLHPKHTSQKGTCSQNPREESTCTQKAIAQVAEIARANETFFEITCTEKTLVESPDQNSIGEDSRAKISRAYPFRVHNTKADVFT
jgi:hypothetical protein